MSEKPDYPPAARVAVWLSSDDVRAAVVRVGMSRDEDMWRACCWDLNYEINKLIEQANQP